MSKAIDVLLVVAPDGQFIFMRDAGHEDASRVMKAWRESQSDEAMERHHQAGTNAGFMTIRMLEEDYNAIPACGSPMAMAASAGKN